MDRTCAGCATELPPPKPHERNPRKWCSGSCRAWSNSHPGQARKPVTQCEYCSRPILNPRVDKIFCSVICGVRQRANVPIPASTPCPECGAVFTPASVRQRYCTKKCAGRVYNRRYLAEHPEKAATYRKSARDSRHAAWHRRRARKVTATVEKFTSVEIFERDLWCCGLCGESVDPTVIYPHPRSASLDHIVPLAGGGDHSRANAQLAHLDCNVRKGAGEQLLLVG